MNEENNREQDKNRKSDMRLKCYSVTCEHRDNNNFNCDIYRDDVNSYGVDDIGPYYITFDVSKHKYYFSVCDHRFSATTNRILKDNDRIFGLSNGFYDYWLKISVFSNARDSMDSSDSDNEHPLNDIIEDRMRPIKNAIMEIDI